MKVKQESIGRLISILYRSGQSYIGKRLERYGVGSGQFAFLAELLQQDGISQEALSSFFRCDKATAARALHRLESQGYVERIRSIEDGRVNLVYLTDKAREFAPTLVDVLSGWTKTLAKGLTTSERKQVVRLLKRLVENASEMKEHDGKQ